MSDTLDVDIDYLDAAGDGVARLGRRVVTVPLTIPGEHVRVAIRHRGGRSSAATRAVLVSVLRASPHRVVPRCSHFGLPGLEQEDQRGCGGCSWQHIAYPEQLRLKSALVERLLSDSLPSTPAVNRTLAGVALDDPWGFRHKVHFVFGNATGARGRRSRLTMGHFRRGSRAVIPVRECPVHDERGNRVAFRFFGTFARAGIAAAAVSPREQSPRSGVLRSLALRVATSSEELMATLVVSEDTDRILRAATRRLLEDECRPTALHLNIHPRGDAFIFGQHTRKIDGPERLRQDIAGTTFLISPTAFFQTNVSAAELLVKLVLTAVPEGAVVLDLYAGAGLFALPLAQRGRVVTAVEESVAAVADGEASARFNRITPAQCRFVARRVEGALRGLRPADAVVLDPPREGCAPGVMREVLGRMRPQRVVYMSCNPEALARDLREATAHRYAIDLVQPVDMFPHTAHVETVVVLTRQS